MYVVRRINTREPTRFLVFLKKKYIIKYRKRLNSIILKFFLVETCNTTEKNYRKQTSKTLKQ